MKKVIIAIIVSFVTSVSTITHAEEKDEIFTDRQEAALGAYLTVIIELNNYTKSRVETLGAIMHSRESELSNTQNISLYRERIRKYRQIKKDHYDALDSLMFITNLAIGKDELTKIRLGGGTIYYEERLELVYLYDLDNYYNFILSNHDKFEFNGEKIFIINNSIRKPYMELLNKVVDSYNNKGQIYNLKIGLIKDRMHELKDWDK